MPRYTLEERIGGGGFGEVWKAKAEDGSIWAVKRLKDGKTKKDIRRFHREVRYQSKLRHKNIVRIVAMDLDDDLPSFVMPLAECSLREMIPSKSEKWLLWAFRCAARGVAHGHEQGVIHRDLKPDNILYYKGKRGTKGRVAVGDFGLGKWMDAESTTLTSTNIRMGTIAYAPPEQLIDAKNVDERADVYSLGKVLYELLSHELPYPLIDLAKVPQKFHYVIRKATNNDPAKRFQSVEELLDALDILLGDQEELSQPAELVEAEIKRILAAGVVSKEPLDDLIRLLVEHRTDASVLQGIVPKLERGLLKRLLREHEAEMTDVIEAFDKDAEGGQPFEYCDVIADFYDRVFDLTKSKSIRTLIIERLPVLGWGHSRWHVGEVFGGILARLKDKDLIMVAADALRANENAAAWCASYIRQHSVPKVILDALDEAEG